MPFVGAYDWPLALRMIGAHAVPGGEITDPVAGTHRRLLPGRRGPVAVTVSPGDAEIIVRVDGDGVTELDVADIIRRLRHWLDLDLDPASPVTRFGGDPVLGPLIADRPGLRRIRYPESFEAAISTVLGQQVSLAAARTFAGRLVAAYGEPGPGGLTAFPGTGSGWPRPISRGCEPPSGSPVHEPGRCWPSPSCSPGPATGRCRCRGSGGTSGPRHCWPCPGIGPWTVAYLRMRLFGDPDAVPVGDLVLRRALGVTKDREVPAAMQRWRPERSYAVFQLWASTAW